MGICQKCRENISLKDDELYCPNCGELPYECWNCKEEITNRKQCIKCGFYPCEYCGVCGKACNLASIIEEVKLLPTDREKIERAFEYFEGKPKLNCIENVPISYSKNRLRQLFLKMNGKNVKAPNDAALFRERFRKIRSSLLSSTWTVNDLREAGTYGQEVRDASYLAVCHGFAKATQIEKVVKGKKQKYVMFERTNMATCPLLNTKKLLVKRCGKCHKTFDDENLTTCPDCIFTKGKQKGQPPMLKEVNSHVDLCQLPRIKFKKRET